MDSDSLSSLTAKWNMFVIVFLGFCFLIKSTGGHILVYRNHSNQLMDEYNDLPAQFGPSLPPNGLKVYSIIAKPEDACEKPLQPPPRGDYYPANAKFVVIIKRGGNNCTFEGKVRKAQAATFDAVIVYNNDSDDLEQMSAKDSTGIDIPSVFVGLTTGKNLKSLVGTEYFLVINDELPFNINTQLILPFSILIGLCFLIMIFYMIYKCIREERRLRRYRLPKSMLKKLKIVKFTKNSDITPDSCVICLEDFVEGDKLRILPCKHPYHSHCIDPWLTENRRVCPICKRKVFTKGEVRTNRSRQSSLDSVTDTDDDTTPLLRPENNSVTVATPADPATRHGTFDRNSEIGTTDDANPTSDDENVLATHQTPQRRVNPFDHPPNFNIGISEPRSIFSFLRFFRRPQPISVAAPPYLEEVVPDNGRHAINSIVATPAASIPSSSNNLLNPNLCGSFKDDDDDNDDESPPQSIYEPIAVVTTTNEMTTTAGANITDADSVFIQTPSQGGIGVVALPNTNINDVLRSMPPNRRQRNAMTNNQFLI